MFYGQNQNIWTKMYSLYHAPIYPENTVILCHKILKSYISNMGCFQHAKLLSIQIVKLIENHMTKKCSSYLVPYTRNTPIYCKACPFCLFSAWKTNPNPYVSWQKSKNLKRKYISYVMLWYTPNILWYTATRALHQKAPFLAVFSMENYTCP